MSSSPLKLNAESFRLKDELGRGATARVLLAENIESGALVCLKQFHETVFNDKRGMARIVREMEVSSRLIHPNIVRVLGVLEGKAPALVMEYVEGEHLASLQQRLPYILPELSVTICIRVLDALIFAHHEGVVHRDLKPENILVSRSGDIKVTDFGLALFQGAQTVTETMTLVGSFDYMAPEQVRGEKLTPLSDLFSLSSVLYFLVTGTKPFLRGSIPATLEAVRTAPVEPPNKRNPKISAELSELILKGLQKDPARRFQSAVEFRDELQTYLKAVGLSSDDFSVSAWRQDPHHFVAEWLERSSDALVAGAREAQKTGNRAQHLRNLVHLSLKAPERSDLHIKPKVDVLGLLKTYKVPALLLALVVLLFVGWRFWGATPTQVEADTAFENHEDAPVLAPAKPQSVSPAKVVRKKKAEPPVAPTVAGDPATITIVAPADAEVFWDFKRVTPNVPMRAQAPGNHTLIVNRIGHDVIRRTIYLEPGSTVRVNYNE